MMVSFREDLNGRFRFILAILFILAIPIILSSLFTCRVTVVGEPYGPGLESRPAGFREIEGPWTILSHNQPSGRLEFYRDGNVWTGRVWFEAWQQWETLVDIIFDPRNGYLAFTRPSTDPIETQRWSGTLTHNQIVGTYLWRGATYSWQARRAPIEGEPHHREPRPKEFHGIEGPWTILSHNQPSGRLEFYRDGNVWTGRVWFEAWQQWETLVDIVFDPRNGYLTFTRPSTDPIETQRWSGTLTHNQIVGTYLWRGATYSWQARRP